MNRLGMACPHCGTWATVRTSQELSPLLRVAYFQCRNLGCGHTWKAHIEAVATISPSAVPRPDVQLPMSPHSEALRLAAGGRQDINQGSFDDV